MSEITHILSPMSAVWSGWAMFILMLCAVLAEVWQPGVISQASMVIVTKANRTYKAAPANFIGQVMVHIFRIGTLSMGVYLCFCEGIPFRFVTFLAICGVVFCFWWIKMAINALIDYTFSLSRRYAAPYEIYSNIATLAVLVLYPLLLLLMRIGNMEAGRWAVGVVVVLFLSLCIYRGGRLFISSPGTLFYFFLYITTLECMPVVALFYLSEKLISII